MVGGFFAKDMAAFQAAARVLLIPSTRRQTTFRRLLLARDAFALADPAAREALMQVRKVGYAHLQAVQGIRSGRRAREWQVLHACTT